MSYVIARCVEDHYQGHTTILRDYYEDCPTGYLWAGLLQHATFFQTRAEAEQITPVLNGICGRLEVLEVRR